MTLSRDGLIVAIGAPQRSLDGSKGEVHIFEWNNDANSWDQKGQIISGEDFGDESGTSVAISGDGTTIASGAPRNDGNGDLSFEYDPVADSTSMVKNPVTSSVETSWETAALSRCPSTL